MAEEDEKENNEETETSFIDKLASGDDEGFKSDIRKHVVDAVAQQVSGVDDVSFDTGSDAESGEESESGEEETDDQ